jgi:enamine deaminase RidA (YjgF/YER057c/UK114 family)
VSGSGFLRAVEPAGFPPPRGYSHGVLAPAGGRLLFVAGQIGWDAEGKLVGDSFVAQFGRALANVAAVVRAAGGAPEHLARLTVYVTDRREYLADLAAVGEAYRAVMGRHYPAMALLEVSGLLEPGAKVEIEGTAVLPA